LRWYVARPSPRERGRVWYSRVPDRCTSIRVVVDGFRAANHRATEVPRHCRLEEISDGQTVVLIDPYIRDFGGSRRTTSTSHQTLGRCSITARSLSPISPQSTNTTSARICSRHPHALRPRPGRPVHRNANRSASDITPTKGASRALLTDCNSLLVNVVTGDQPSESSGEITSGVIPPNSTRV
jgi:hypothetical protein